MSTDPRDILSRPMSADELRFWEAVAPNGSKVTVEQLYQRLDAVLAANDDMIRLPDAEGYVLYSGDLHPRGTPDNTSMHDAAKELYARSGGRMGIIDETVTGRSLGTFAELAGASVGDQGLVDDIVARYGRYIDFDGSEARIGTQAFTDASYRAFDMPSKHFATYAHGDVIALSPQAWAGGAYARVELPTVLQGMESGRIDTLNGLDADDLAPAIAEARAKGFALVDPPPADPRKIPAYLDDFPYETGRAQGNAAMAESITRAGGLDAYLGDVLDELGPARATPGADPDAPDSRTPPDTSVSPDARTPDVDVPDANPGRGASVFDDAVDDANALRAGSPGASAGDLAARNASSLPVGERIDAIIEASSQGRMRAFAGDPDGRSVYILDEVSNSLHHIEEGVLRTSASFDDLQDAQLAFGSLLHGAGRSFPDAFDGLPKISGSLGELADHMASLRAPGWVRSAAGAADEAGSFLGRASKILGPLGVAAAGYEVYSLESKFVDFTSFGLIDAEASWAYRGILTAHLAQATADPSLVVGEGAVQGAYELWAQEHEINDEVKEALRPGSLVRDVAELSSWIGDRAAEAKESVEEYIATRADNPGLIIEDFEKAGRLGSVMLETAYDRGAEIAGDLGSYASSRWDNPELLGEDLKAAGTAIRDGARWVYDRGSELWDRAFGDDPAPETVMLGDSPSVELELSLGDAARQYVLDRDAVREAAGGQETVLDSDEVGQLFNSAQAAGVENVTVTLSEEMSSAERARAILEGVNSAYRSAEAERTVERSTEPEMELEAEY